MMCKYSALWLHAHVYIWKLGPGFVLLASVVHGWIDFSTVVAAANFNSILGRFLPMLEELQVSLLWWISQPGVQAIKPFYVSLMRRQNKLMCLPNG